MIRPFFSVVLLSVLLVPAARASQVEAVSVPATPGSTGTAEASLPRTRSAVSNDGRWVVFVSQASDLVPGQVDTGATDDVFLRDRVAGTTILVSHSTAGANVAASGNYPMISDDGGVVAFYSDAGHLFPGDTGPGSPYDWKWNLYLYERATGTIQRITPPDTMVYRLNEGIDLSADGRWLVYNREPNIYLFDRLTGEETLVDRSAISPGQASNHLSRLPKISADGRYIAFHSTSTDIVADQRGPGAFLYDRIQDTMTRVTDTPTRELRLSADGRWLAFLSQETGLIPGQVDSNGSGFDVFLWDRVTGGLTLVSRSAASPLTTAARESIWAPADNDYHSATNVLSADGRFIVFFSKSHDIAGEDPGSESKDVFLFDRVTGTTTRVSRASTPSMNESLWGLALSEDGSRVAYISESGEEVPGQTDSSQPSADAFVFDRVAGTREIASRFLGSATRTAGVGSDVPHLSADGRVTAFNSLSPALVEDDLTEGNVFAYVIPNPGKGFYTVTPCRLLDSRLSGPVLSSEVPRKVIATGSCGIPATARSLAVNVTLLQPSGAGRLVLQPGDVSSEGSSVHFAAGDTRAHHATVALAFDGTGTLSLTPRIDGGGTVHVLLDVFGYHQ